MGYFKAVFNGEVVKAGWARDVAEFSSQKCLVWYWENGGLDIIGGY